jgi:hypothetical protein
MKAALNFLPTCTLTFLVCEPHFFQPHARTRTLLFCFVFSIDLYSSFYIPLSHLRDRVELGDLAENLLNEEAAKKKGSVNADGDEEEADASSSQSCGDSCRRAAAGKAVHFLEGALPPVTGTFRRAYVTADMALSYSTLAITTVLNIYTAIALWSMPVNPDALLLGFVPQVHLYAFFILCVEAVRLLSAVSAMPFQVCVCFFEGKYLEAVPTTNR